MRLQKLVRFGKMRHRMRLALMLLFTLVAMASTDLDVSGTVFLSPIEPTEDPRKDWISTAGGVFVKSSCPGVELTFPADFLDRDVNAHCNAAELKLATPEWMQDVGLRYYMGVWSGYGEVTEFLKPIVVSIDYATASPDAQQMLVNQPERLRICLYSESEAEWWCVPTDVDNGKNSASAAIDRLFPMRQVQGWDGNSFVALMLVDEPLLARARQDMVSTSSPAPVVADDITSTQTSAVSEIAVVESGDNLLQQSSFSVQPCIGAIMPLLFVASVVFISPKRRR